MINISAIFFARCFGLDYPSTNPTASNLIESLSHVESVKALGRSRLIFKGIDFSKCSTAKDALFKLLAETYELVGRIEGNFNSLISVYVFTILVDVGKGDFFQEKNLYESNTNVEYQEDILKLGLIIQFMTDDERKVLIQGLRESIELMINKMIQINDFRHSNDAVRKIIYLLGQSHDQFSVVTLETLLAPKVKQLNKRLPAQLSMIIQNLLLAVERRDTSLVDRLITELSSAYGSNNLISKPVEIFQPPKAKSMWDTRDSESWREQI